MFLVTSGLTKEINQLLSAECQTQIKNFKKTFAHLLSILIVQYIFVCLVSVFSTKI